jgi:hypothetical protein
MSLVDTEDKRLESNPESGSIKRSLQVNVAPFVTPYSIPPETTSAILPSGNGKITKHGKVTNPNW